ncbi:uncharacterized protein LOC131848190 [Achroia grisella]|uniref:uncharacterized protein LOC131848190 n=1 Tax=Achroia grisella TaxID=688607 RepID=UPI0027D278EC|nr:uncharacterized protein LOC131848190 [Achroia grisella]
MDSYSNENTVDFNIQQQPSGSGPEQIGIAELSLVKQPSGSVSECSTADFQDVYEFDVVPDEELQRFQYNNGKLYIRPDIEFHVNVTVKNMGEKPMYLCAFIDSPYQTPVLKHNKTCQNLLSGNTEQMLSLHSCDTNTESVHNDDTGSMNAILRHVSTKLEPSKIKPFYGYNIVYENNTCKSGGYVVGQKKLQVVLTSKPRNAILHAINNNGNNGSQSTEGSGQTKTVKNKRKIVESKQDMEDSNDSDIPLAVLRKKKKEDNNNQIYIVPSIYVKNRLLFHKLIKTNINEIKSHLAQNNEEDAEHLNANIAVLEHGLSSV